MYKINLLQRMEYNLVMNVDREIVILRGTGNSKRAMRFRDVLSPVNICAPKHSAGPSFKQSLDIYMTHKIRLVIEARVLDQIIVESAYEMRPIVMAIFRRY